MRKMILSYRSRNSSAVYIVLRDGSANTVEVWMWTFADPPRLCRSWSFTVSKDGWDHVSSSEAYARRRACNLANALSRMSPAEVIRQADNLREFGEVR